MPVSLTTARSWLFVPGDRPERFGKAAASGSDAIILDLEDAVPVAGKDAARNAVAEWLRSTAPGAAPRVVRINDASSPQFAADVAMLGALQAEGRAPDGIVLPKAERAATCAQLHAQLPGLALLPLVESARGIAALAEVAGAPGVQRLLFGSIDLQLDLGIEQDGEALLFFRSQLVLHARLAGLPSPVDGVSTALDDADRVRAETLYARRLGFGAKLCIHPRQLAPVHDALRPSDAQLAWAQRVVAASEAAGGAAVALDGAMVDKPVLLRAQALLAAAT